MRVSTLILLVTVVFTPATYGSHSIDPDIRILVPGPGFMGPTDIPERVGSPTSRGYGAESIARWTEFPFINRSDDFYVTISAFHMTGIDRVEFSLNGGDPVVTEEVQAHPETGYAEYIAKIDVSDLAIGQHEIRAIIYPNHGLPRVLQGEHDTSDIHVMNNGNQSFWFNYEPDPRVVRVGPNSEFSSIDQALTAMGSQIITGRIELEAGNYTWFTKTHTNLNNTSADRVLEICAAPGVSRDQVTMRAHPTSGTGPRNLSIYLRGVTLLSEVQRTEVPRTGTSFEAATAQSPVPRGHPLHPHFRLSLGLGIR